MGRTWNRLRGLPWPVQILLLGAAHYATARLGLTFGRLDSIVAPIWPPSGVALAGLWIFGLRAWPGVAISALIVDLGGDLPVGTALGMAAGTTLEGVVAVILLRRAGFGPALSRLRDVATLVMWAGVVACAAGAAIGAASLTAGGTASGGFWEVWRVWWLGDVLGVLVFGAALLTAAAAGGTDARPGTGRRLARWAQATAIAAAVAGIAILGFGPEPVPPYLLFPFVAWLAARGSPGAVAWAVMVAGVVAVVRTTGEHGPFAGPDPIASLYQLDAFLAVLAVSGLALAAVVGERNRAAAKLRRSRDRLEVRVAARTAALERDRGRLAEAQRIARLGSWEWDVGSDGAICSDEMLRVLGIDPGPFTVSDYIELVHPDDRDTARDRIRQALRDGTPFSVHHRIVRPDGAVRWVRSEGRANLDSTGAVVRMAGTCQDVTDRQQAEERFRDLLEAAPDAMLIVDADGRLSLVNRQTERLFGYSRSELIGQPVELLLPERFREVHAGHRHGFFATPKTRSMGAGAELYARRKDGSEVPVEISLSPLVIEEQAFVSAAVRDVTRRRQAEAALAHQALHDALTGLPNRVLLSDRLEQALARAARRSGPDGPEADVAVLFLDLDRFKLLNDSLGHAAGDEVLMAVADRLRAAVRATDTVARFGGDEFVVVCEGGGEAPRLAHRLLAALQAPFAVGGEEVFLSVSVGVAVAAKDVASPETLLRDADAAMYRAKEHGRARVVRFDETMRTEAATRLENQNALPRALARREFRVVYQPIIDLRTGRVDSVEALARWQHPERGLVGPAEFIPAAEETGLIVPLGTFVLEEAVRRHLAWREQHPDLVLAVNLSARQLRQADLVPSVAALLERTGLAPGALSFELTESVLMEDLDAYRRSLDALRELGVRLAIDDFGTGYSSLTYLRRFPVDIVKIDRTFVQGLAHDAADRAIVESVIDLAHALGLRVVAEGVECEAQLALLTDLGCDLAQGYLFARPQPAEATAFVLGRSFVPAPLAPTPAGS